MEDLLSLSNMQLQSIISGADGHCDDIRKLSAALSLLRKFQGKKTVLVLLVNDKNNLGMMILFHNSQYSPIDSMCLLSPIDSMYVSLF